MNDLNGKSIIITGASSGIGAATARELAGTGMHVMLAARREGRLSELQSEIRKAGGTAEICTADVTDAAAVQRLVQTTIQSFGHVDAIFNNAGLMPLSMLEKLHVDEWERMVDVNIKGVLNGIAAVLPHMLERGSGHVINNASIAGHVVFPGGAVYCATKFAVRALSEGLRQEMGPRVRCTIISPGAIETELPNTITDTDVRHGMDDVLKLAIDPSAIARAVRFALEQPADVDVNEIVVRPTAQAL